MSILRVVLALILVPLSLAAAGHDVSSVRYAPGDLSTGSASVAYNGNRFLTLFPMTFHLYGLLADPTGSALAPAFPAVPFATPNVLQLTSAGSGYLAIWNEQQKATLGVFNADGVLVRRVPLDGDQFAAPRLAFDGTNALVVDRQGGMTVSVFDLTGRLVSRFPLPGYSADTYAVTAAGADFIIVTAGGSGINEWRLAADGTVVSTMVVEPAPINGSPSLYDVAVTAKNGRIAMAWTQRQLTTVSSAVIAPDGSITRYALAKGLGPVSGVAILPVDIGFLVAWNEQRTLSETKVVAALLDDGGIPLDARPVDLGNGPFTSATSSGKTIALLTTASRTTMLLADVDANGISPRTPAPFAIAPVRQLLPALTGNGAGFTTAWLDFPKDSQTAAAGHVTAKGEALDGPGITLGQLGQPGTSPAIAHGSSGELVVWSANGNLVAARLTSFGTIDATPIVISSLSNPALVTYSVAWNGSRFFVVWADGAQLFGAFVGPDGIVAQPRPLGIQIPPNIYPTEPDVAWDGHQFILVYGELASVPCVEGCIQQADSIRLLRVSTGGIAIDANPVRIPGVHVRAHVASSGLESLIALDTNTDTSAMIVREQSFLLQLGPEIPLFHWFSTFGSDVAWTGSMYVVAWPYAFLQTRPGWIGFSRISRSGVPFGALFTPTAGSAESGTPLSKASVAANTAGEAAAVISEMAPPTYVARARLYLMSELASLPPPPEPPRYVVAYRAATKTVITWESGAPRDGFLIEVSVDSGRNWYPNAVTGDVRSMTMTSYPPYYLFRIRTIGPGGLSEPAAASLVIVERRRAERP
jgi:hypothetical protein